MTREEEAKQDADYWLIIAGNYRQERDCARAEIKRLRSVMQQTEDAMNRACLRDGGSYWLPAPGHQIEAWSGNLNTALEYADNQQLGSDSK